MTPSIKEIEKFIDSSFCKVSTKIDRAFIVSGVDRHQVVETKPGYESIFNTPGFRSLQATIEKQGLRFEQESELNERLRSKYIAMASGNITIHFEGPSGHEDFFKKDIPQILANPKITDINNQDKEVIRTFVGGQGELSAGQRDRLVAYLQDQLATKDLYFATPEPGVTREEALKLAVTIVGGERLQAALSEKRELRLGQNIALLEKYHYESKVELLGWRKRLPWVAVSLYRDRQQLRAQDRVLGKLERTIRAEEGRLVNEFLKKDNVLAVNQQMMKILDGEQLDLTRGEHRVLQQQIEKELRRRMQEVEPVKSKALEKSRAKGTDDRER